ncbi:hypothetical protein BD289DRAFT_12716 [Coniella lustricola]|uniref:Uncharacterized protein n=1 Tax=Coniella lustricola TaxID=2025994 RepID=A0A2T3A4C8_9PEZI|nr:hypothetical protein BD289DRAFT_12716 [Coniella lustricola]
MDTVRYDAVHQDEQDDGEKGASSLPLNRPWSSKPKRSLGTQLILALALFASLLANAYFLDRQYLRPWALANELPTRYANLKRNIPTENVAHDAFDSINRTTQDAAWNDWTMEPWQSFVALDEDYVIDVDLPHAQRWPWDKTKGTYILTAAHELHCVRVLRTAVNEAHDGVPEENQSWQYEHLIHCLNLLRKTVVCNADDTPLYTGHLHANAKSEHPNAGIGSTRMCRDWNALLTWSRARSACYRPVNWSSDYPEIERYKYCPDGSRPWEKDEHEKL